VRTGKPVFFSILENTNSVIMDGRKFVIGIVPGGEAIIISERLVSIESSADAKKADLRNELDRRREDTTRLRNEAIAVTLTLTHKGLSPPEIKDLEETRTYKEALCRQHDERLEQIEECGRAFTYTVKTKSTYKHYTLKNGVQSQVGRDIMVYLMVMSGAKNLNDPLELGLKIVDEVDTTEHTGHLTDSDAEEGDTDDDDVA
jgi:hypothetical protein